MLTKKDIRQLRALVEAGDLATDDEVVGFHCSTGRALVVTEGGCEPLVQVLKSFRPVDADSNVTFITACFNSRELLGKILAKLEKGT